MALGYLLPPNTIGPAGPQGSVGPAGTAGTVGTATLNFGAAPGSQFATVTVTGQAAILSTSSIMCYIMASDSTTDNNAMIHQIAPLIVRGGNISVGVGFTIYAYCQWNLSNTVTVRWQWT